MRKPKRNKSKVAVNERRKRSMINFIRYISGKTTQVISLITAFWDKGELVNNLVHTGVIDATIFTRKPKLPYSHLTVFNKKAVVVTKCIKVEKRKTKGMVRNYYTYGVNFV